MKYLVTLRNRTYEVEVEHGEAMILDEYEAKAPVSSVAPAAAAPAPAATPAPAAPAPTAIADGTPVPSPLPGMIMNIKVTPGQAVKKGDVLLIIEAMKMENEVMAPSDGQVKQILVSKGQNVATGDNLVVI